MASIDGDQDFPVYRLLEKNPPTGWEPRQVPDWEEGVLEYRREKTEGMRNPPSVKVFDTDFDQYRVRLDTGDYGTEVEAEYVDSLEEAVDQMDEMAADYNLREFMESF